MARPQTVIAYRVMHAVSAINKYHADPLSPVTPDGTGVGNNSNNAVFEVRLPDGVSESRERIGIAMGIHQLGVIKELSGLMFY
jgi:hypothetical protein